MRIITPPSPSLQAIKEGETGTHFYIIKTGAVKVSTDGIEVATLNAGDHFGERSLLTATTDPAATSLPAAC